ncbi:MAG TPA: hypothetical protein VIJ59_10415 [Caulobacteraceae bacterium]
MTRIDLDDLPPRVAAALEGLQTGHEVMLVRGGAVIARLTVGGPSAPTVDTQNPPSEQDMKEVMEHFNSMIHDEF